MLKKHNISSKSLIEKRLLMEAKARAFFVNHKLMNHFHEERSNEDEVIHGMIHSKHIEEMNSTQELNVQVEIPNSSTEENMSLDNFQENILTEADKELEVLATNQLEVVHSQYVGTQTHQMNTIFSENVLRKDSFLTEDLETILSCTQSTSNDDATFYSAAANFSFFTDVTVDSFESTNQQENSSSSIYLNKAFLSSPNLLSQSVRTITETLPQITPLRDNYTQTQHFSPPLLENSTQTTVRNFRDNSVQTNFLNVINVSTQTRDMFSRSTSSGTLTFSTHQSTVNKKMDGSSQHKIQCDKKETIIQEREYSSIALINIYIVLRNKGTTRPLLKMNRYVWSILHY